MISEIYIQKKRLDISAEISSLLTFNLDDVKEFASRNTTLSKTIVLPGTANNSFLFGNIYQVMISNSYNASGENVSTNFNAAVSADCLIFQNHIQVFKGTMRMLEIVITNGVPEYEVSVVGELGGFINEVGNGKIEDLDFSLYDHSYSVANIIASWDNPPGSGYYYPLVDRGNVSALKVNYDVKAFRPGLYVKEYIDKMFTAAGYTYSCDLFQTDRFKRLLIPHNSKDFKRASTFKLQVSQTNEHYLNTDGPNWAIEFVTHTVLSDFTIDVNNELCTYTGASAFSGDIVLSLSGTYTKNSSSSFEVQLLINGVIVGTSTIGAGSLSGSYSVQISKNTVLNTNDYIQTFIVAPAGATTWDLLMIATSLTARSTTASLVDIVLGNNVTMHDQIPKNVTQIDFFASIIKLFNLYVYDDQFTSKKLLISPYVDFYDLNVSGVVDWNYKMDRSRPMRVRPMSELNYRFFDFIFTPDNDFYNEAYKKKFNESYGDYFYDSGYQFEKDRAKAQLIFSPTVLVGYAGVDKIVPVTYKKPAGVEQDQDINIRIFQTLNVTGVTAWDMKDGVSVVSAGLTKYGYGGHYDDPDAPSNDIHFGVPQELYFTLAAGAINVTQFNVYWSPYMAEITDKDSKLLTAWFKLTAADIFDLNFSKLIYCEGSYWRLNKIEDWNASQPDVCKVELLKLINTVY